MRPVRDADRHYTIFTENHGKISVLAKGSRRGRSKMSPHLAAFDAVDLMIARGRMIDRLAGTGLSRSFGGILGSLPKTAAAQSFLLTVDALTKRELPEERIFCLIHELMAALDESRDAAGADAYRPIFDAAVIKLLDILGFAPEMQSCIRCRRPATGEGLAIDTARGGVECSACRGRDSLSMTPETLETLRSMRRHDLSAMISMTDGERSWRQAGAIIELLLAGHIDDRLAALGYMKAVGAVFAVRPAAGRG